MNYLPPLPEDGEVPDRAAVADDGTHEIEPQGSEAPESTAKHIESSAERSESSRTVSSPPSTTSPNTKKRQWSSDKRNSGSSKLAEDAAKVQSDELSLGFDFFGHARCISS